MKFRNPNKLSDNEIIAKYNKTGDNNYIGILFERYSHLVYGVCLKYLRHEEDSKDAVIQIFEILMKELRKVQVEYFKSWLYGLSRNYCLMQLRGNSRARKRMNNWKTEEKNKLVQVEENEIQKKEDQLETMEEAVKQLKAQQKECIELFYLHQKCYKEVAEITGYSIKQVKSYIQNGKRNLKHIMTVNNENYYSE